MKTPKKINKFLVINLLITGLVFVTQIKELKAMIAWIRAEDAVNRGVNKVVQGKYDQAIEYYNQAIQLDPNLVRAYINRGDAHFLVKDYQGTIEDINWILRYIENGISFFGYTYKALPTTWENGIIGADLTKQGNNIYVLRVLPDTPAWKEGLKKGDQILTIDGNSTKNMSPEEAVSLVKGQENTQVNLTIARSGKNSKKTLTRVPYYFLPDGVKGVYLVHDASIDVLLNSVVGISFFWNFLNDKQKQESESIFRQIQYVSRNSPVSLSGLKHEEDQILEINGQTIENIKKMSKEEKIKFNQKNIGDKIVVKIARPGLFFETKSINITHSFIDLYLEGKIDYRVVGTFDDRTIQGDKPIGNYDVHQSYKLRGYAYCAIGNEQKARKDWQIEIKLYSDINEGRDTRSYSYLKRLDKYKDKNKSCMEKIKTK